ncbi:hypothetical protein [Actinoplanes sp. NPDC089786]|uniref:hypothetical protein n=1 Tax=Actinoplanes sp. NPDC089786 TaxID=3155185 RepID=UPI0034308DA2
MGGRAPQIRQLLLEIAGRLFLSEAHLVEVIRDRVGRALDRTLVLANDAPVDAAVRLVLEDPEFGHPTERLGAYREVYETASAAINQYRSERASEDALDNEDDEEREPHFSPILKFVAFLICVALLALCALSAKLNSWIEGLSPGRNIAASALPAWRRIVQNWHSISAIDQAFTCAGLICVTLLVILVFRTMKRQLKKAWNSEIAEYAELLRPTLRALLNELSNEDEDVLYIDRAPGLGDTDAVERLISRPELDQIRVLNTTLGARAIAVSGPRGVGKTALLTAFSRQLHGNHGPTLKVLVSAPVTYDAREFLVHLYIQICERVLEAAGNPSRPASRIALASIRKLIRTAAILAAFSAFFASLFPGFRAVVEGLGIDLPSPGLASYLGLPALIVVWKVTDRLRSGLVWQPTSAIVRRTHRELRMLRYLQTSTSERSGFFKKAGVELGGKAVRQLAQQPTTLPEVVSSYRSFVGATVHWLTSIRQGEPHLLICIDEVDRIAKAEDAERFLNDVKAIFDVRGCSYIVTVSEDALAGFERRVMRVRPALDSAFDEVVRLQPFTFNQSLQLVTRSVIGLPPKYVMLCHCIAGGIPRDLVRAVRAIFAHRHRTEATDIDTIVEELVAGEVRALKRGLLARVVGNDDFSSAPQVLSVLGDDSKMTAKGLLEAASSLSLLETERSSTEAVAKELASALCFYATIQEAFVSRSIYLANSTQIVDQLAATRGLLPVSSLLAMDKLNRLRRTIKLKTIADESSSGMSEKGSSH